jgi:S-DNA-T family DNA segregation ATPase FtsK/SpoIIIE
MVHPGEATDPARLIVGRVEDGTPYHLRLLGTHLLVVGATGSGKGSVLWSIIAALAPGIREGLVQLWALDPKGGMEFAFGRPLFARFVYGDAEEDAGSTSYEQEFARVLEDAVRVMRRRQSSLRGRTRLHQPSAAEPLIVVVVDEIASLTAYVTDRDAKRGIDAALSLLLSQGRAVGVLVVGAVQDPRKDVLALRDLFPTRVALRLIEAEAVDMTLGRGARLRGAKCDEIPESLPGVGYVALDGIPEPVRVRFCHITDAHIFALASNYRPGTSSEGATEPVQLRVLHSTAADRVTEPGDEPLSGGDAA